MERNTHETRDAHAARLAERRDRRATDKRRTLDRRAARALKYGALA